MMKFFPKIGLISYFFFWSFTTLAQTKSESVVQNYLVKNHSFLGLERNDVMNWVVTDDYASHGIHHFYIKQTIEGIVLENGTANFTLDKNSKVVYLTHNLKAKLSDRNFGITPSIKASNAILKALKHLNLSGDFGPEIKSASVNRFKFGKGSISQDEIIVQLKFWDNGEVIRLAWVVNIQEKSGQHWWDIFIDATTGEEIHRVDWIHSCEFDSHSKDVSHSSAGLASSPKNSLSSFGSDQYNVFPIPVESPNHGSISLKVNPSNAGASPFGWHDDNGVLGHEYTITRGNNVYAYEDSNNNNTPGYSPDGGSTLDFNFLLNINQNPVNYQDPVITNIFYTCNRIHDILYEYGFDESSGNFQENNYGNGGLASDHLFAEAQDGGGANNANFASPPDGLNSRMQMYLWTAPISNTNILTINSPSSIAGNYGAFQAGFGPGIPTVFPITNDFVLFEDGISPISDACEVAVNSAALNGKIAILYRGNCGFTAKVLNAQNAGAIAVIVINDNPGPPIAMVGANASIVIPSIMISEAEGALFINQMNLGVVNASLLDAQGTFDLDGGLDNSILVHEYGHGVSNRLTGGPLSAGCLGNLEQMGEGWSDFLACVLTMDTTVLNPVNRPIGTYAAGEPTTGPGIRLAPYDTSFAVNDFTYGSLTNTVAISQPHGIGFVWATMLWDLTWALIEVHGFDEDLENGNGGNNIALKLVIEGLKLQPCSPGFVDGRDAILMADSLLFGGANHCLIWKAFAKRGLGFSADQGSSNNRLDQIEAFDIPIYCRTPVTAPTANFDANANETCTGKIYFKDLSTDVPQAWHWDFGDGSSSVSQNPSHTYLTSGFFTVKLVITNIFGSDSLVQLSLIEVKIPTPPTVMDGSGCSSDSIPLFASGTDLIHWTDINGNLLDTGNVFFTSPSSTNTSYYAVNVDTNQAHFFVGPATNLFGGGGNHSSNFEGGLNFTADKELVIHSALVYSGAIGMRRISLYDSYNNGGAVLQVINVFIPFIGPGRIELNIVVPQPGKYSFGLDNAEFYRNNSGAQYPYTIPGLISLVGSPAGPDFYYYFYDLEVFEPNCTSDSILVTATVTLVDFSSISTGLTVDFTDLSVGSNFWAWDFGDGTSSTLQNPSHTYSSPGIYPVTLSSTSGCIASYDINVGGIGILELVGEPLKISLFPNPAKNRTILSLSRTLKTNARLEIFSIDGKLVREISIPKDKDQVSISLDKIPSQVYYFVLHHEGGQERMKFAVEK